MPRGTRKIQFGRKRITLHVHVETPEKPPESKKSPSFFVREPEDSPTPSFHKYVTSEIERKSRLSRDDRDFYYSLTDAEQSKYEGLITEITDQTGKSVEPMRFRTLGSSLPNDLKLKILSRLDRQQETGSAGNDAAKFFCWAEAALALPLRRACVPDIVKGGGAATYLANAKQALDASTYGHETAKQALLECVAQWIHDPVRPTRPIGLQGVMGNGKTTLISRGLAGATSRPFSFLPLGGATDASYLIGHSYTFEGSMPGKIAECLCVAGCMNPIIYFDELDKVSETPKGDEITNVLIHLTDTAQNSHFKDRFLGNVSVDLSHAMIVFSFNDISKVNKILLDRLYVIETDTFDTAAQRVIAKTHIVPRTLSELGLSGDICFEDGAAEKCVIPGSGGVRNIKKMVETLCRKAIIWNLTREPSLILPLSLEDFMLQGLVVVVTVSAVEKIISLQSTTATVPVGMYI